MEDDESPFRDEQGHYRSIVEAQDTPNIGTIVLDSELSVVWANRAIAEFFGLSRSTLVGADKQSLIQSEIREIFSRPERFADRMQRAYENNASPEEVECHILPSESRDERWVLHRSQPVEQGQHAGGRVEQYVDITDRKQREQALEESREKFQTIFEHANDAIFIVDVENDSIVDCNPAAADLVEFSRDELLSMPASDLHPHNLSEFMDFADSVFEEGHGFTDDITCYCKSGDIIPAHMSASVIELDGRPHLVNHIRDTSDRDERDWFEGLIENSSDLITVLKRDGTVRYQSPSIDHVLGYTTDEIRDETFFEYVHPDDREEMKNTLEQLVDASVVTRRIEYRFRHANGSWAWLESIGSHRPDSTITGYVLNSRDITARKQSSQQAAVLNRVLRHNLRNRLNVIQGAAEQLRESESSAESAHLDRILRNVSHLENLSSYTNILNDILELHRLRHYQIEVTSLLEKSCQTFREENPAVEFDCDFPDEQRVRGVSNVDVALDHVIENAIEHNDAETPRISVSVRPPRPDGDEVEVTVADNGPGIPEQEREVLLEGKETPLRHGSGVGLWIVNWIVTRSGGRIVFDENEPRGSRITLYFPPVEEDGQANDEPLTHER